MLGSGPYLGAQAMSPYFESVDSLALQLLCAQARKQWQAAVVHCLYVAHGRFCVIPK
jgi:hypothetical protein